MTTRSRPFLTYVLVPIACVVLILANLVMMLWAKAKTILTLFMLFTFYGCSSFGHPSEGCIVRNDSMYTSYERVHIIGEYKEDPDKWEVTYPDSDSKRPFVVAKSQVRFGCPGLNSPFSVEYR